MSWDAGSGVRVCSNVLRNTHAVCSLILNLFVDDVMVSRHNKIAFKNDNILIIIV